MEAIEFPGANVRIAEGQDEYQTLPAFAGPIPFIECAACLVKPNQACEHCNGTGFLSVPGITCCFKLTPEELAEVNRTGVIWHTVLTFGKPLQPQSMSLQRPEWVPNNENNHQSACEDATGNQRP